MDAKIATSLEDLEALFCARMSDYEEKLVKASSSSAPAPDLTSLLHEFTEFKTFVWQALSKLKSQMELLSLGLDRHETAMRRKVLLIHGVPEHKDEKVHDVVTKVLCDQMNLPEVGKANIHVCHHLGHSKRSSRPILIRFYSTEHRHLVWDSKKSLKGTGITITEFLTQMRHQTFLAARKHFGMTNCWSVEGKIVVIAPDKTRHKIESKGELQELVSRFPLSSADKDDPVQPEDQGSPSAGAEPAAKAQRKARQKK